MPLHDSSTSLPTVLSFIDKKTKRIETELFHCTNHWNKLPSAVTESATLHSFERKLDNTWKEHVLKFDFRSDCSPIVNNQSLINVDETDTAHAEDMDT